MQRTGDQADVCKTLARRQLTDKGVIFSRIVERQIDRATERIFIVILQDGNFIVRLLNSLGNGFFIHIPQRLKQTLRSLDRSRHLTSIHRTDGVAILQRNLLVGNGDRAALRIKAKIPQMNQQRQHVVLACKTCFMHGGLPLKTVVLRFLQKCTLASPQKLNPSMEK